MWIAFDPGLGMNASADNIGKGTLEVRPGGGSAIQTVTSTT